MNCENPIKMVQTVMFIPTMVFLVLSSTSGSLVDGQVLNLPPSFLQHNHPKDHLHNHKPQDDRKFSPSKEILVPLSKQPEIKAPGNEPRTNEQPSTTAPTFCNVEIATKIPGNCITVGQLGRACVAGDYLDLFSIDCM